MEDKADRGGCAATSVHASRLPHSPGIRRTSPETRSQSSLRISPTPNHQLNSRFWTGDDRIRLLLLLAGKAKRLAVHEQIEPTGESPIHRDTRGRGARTHRVVCAHDWLGSCSATGMVVLDSSAKRGSALLAILSVYRVRVANVAKKDAADLLDDLEPLMETGHWCAPRRG